MEEYKRALIRIIRVFVSAALSAGLLATIQDLGTWTPSTSEHQLILGVVTALLVGANKLFREKGNRYLGL